MKKKSLLELVKNNFPQYTKDQAYALILSGKVSVNGEKMRVTTEKCDVNAVIDITDKNWVSRGAYKLLTALKCFDLDVKGKVFVDAGCSTGGFTDVLLQNGAEYVYAVDVGYNQLDYRLRNDSRVGVFERTNIMHFKPDWKDPDIAVADISFRSMSGVCEYLINLVKMHRIIVLIKPQFELKNPDENFDGVIRDEDEIKRVLLDVFCFIEEAGLSICDAVESEVKGRKGNREFLVDIEQSPQRTILKKEEFLGKCGF